MNTWWILLCTVITVYINNVYVNTTSKNDCQSRSKTEMSVVSQMEAVLFELFKKTSMHFPICLIISTVSKQSKKNKYLRLFLCCYSIQVNLCVEFSTCWHIWNRSNGVVGSGRYSLVCMLKIEQGKRQIASCKFFDSKLAPDKRSRFDRRHKVSCRRFRELLSAQGLNMVPVFLNLISRTFSSQVAWAG